jgi:hypothetical protein
MAIATSMLHRSFKGAIGDFIFRTYNGKTVVSLRPVYKNETNTEARFKARDRFRKATGYASNAMGNVKQKAYYTQKARQLKLPNAYTAALTDYLRRAKAGAITRSSFAAKKGDIIYIKASKSVFRINRIRVVACTTQGEVLTDQELTKANGQNLFQLQLMDDWLDFANLKVTTDEPGYKEYIIPLSEFLLSPIPG